jgi:hypothetical protein
MSDKSNKPIYTNDQLDMGLREGLRSLPVPEPSAAFDARILAALKDDRPAWLRFWVTIRPTFSAAACSLALTLAFIHWSSMTSVAQLPTSQASGTPVQLNEQALDTSNLTGATLLRLSTILQAPPPAVGSPADDAEKSDGRASSLPSPSRSIPIFRNHRA